MGEMRLACKHCTNYKPCSMLPVLTLLTELLSRTRKQSSLINRFPPICKKLFILHRIFYGLGVSKPRRWFLDSCSLPNLNSVGQMLKLLIHHYSRGCPHNFKNFFRGM